MANETTENELNQTGEPGTEYFMETLPGQDRYVAPLEAFSYPAPASSPASFL